MGVLYEIQTAISLTGSGFVLLFRIVYYAYLFILIIGIGLWVYARLKLRKTEGKGIAKYKGFRKISLVIIFSCLALFAIISLIGRFGLPKIISSV